jgi:transposase, IS6 family
VAETDLFKWRHYESEIILLCMRWYLRYALSYRDLEEMMNERSLSVDHTTIYRWVQAYAPELATGQKFNNLPPDNKIEALEVGH